MSILLDRRVCGNCMTLRFLRTYLDGTAGIKHWATMAFAHLSLFSDGWNGPDTFSLSVQACLVCHPGSSLEELKNA